MGGKTRPYDVTVSFFVERVLVLLKVHLAWYMVNYYRM